MDQQRTLKRREAQYWAGEAPNKESDMADPWAHSGRNHAAAFRLEGHEICTLNYSEPVKLVT